MYTIPVIFNWLQEKAKPCAWFPALAQTIPFSSSFGSSAFILLNAPLILKDLTCCWSSLLRNMEADKDSDKRLLNCNGVSCTTVESTCSAF